MAYENGHSGWSVEFTLARDSAGGSKDAVSSENSTAQRNEDDAGITVQSGLHCGPAGRRTLIKWIEDNYKLRVKTHQANPGVVACRLWQASQGFSDPAAKAIVDLLKLNGVPANITYKEVFENHLCKLLSTLIKKSADDKERLMSLAEKMIAMFQVTEIQPLLAEVLDKIEDIPPIAMSKLLDKTASAEHFFKIAPINVKRKILAAAPEKLYDTVAPLIENALFMLDLGILDEGMQGLPLYNGYLKEYQKIIDTIVNLIGPPKTETSRIIYFLVQQCLRRADGKISRYFGGKNKDIDYDVCFDHISFQALKLTLSNSNGDEAFDDYRRYAQMSIGLLYNLERNADETVKSVSEMRYSGNGFWNISAIRHSITTTYQETYRLGSLEMQMMEPFSNLVQLVSSIIDRNATKLPTELLHKLTKPKKDQKVQLPRIKDDMELFDVAFILSHPTVVGNILGHTVKYVQNTNVVLISPQSGVEDWLPLLALACKFLLEADLYFQGKNCKGDTNCAIENDCFCRSFLKPSNSTGKPVSLAKLISYVYPIDKQIRSADKGVPPFLSNLLTMKMSQREPGSSETRHNNEQEVTFHELLVLYLPRINIEQLKAFISTCTSFCTSVNVANRDVVDMRESTALLGTILDVIHEHMCDPREYINQMSSIIETHSANITQRYNLQLMEQVYSKFNFLNSTVMGIIITTSDITNMFMKMMAIKMVAESVTNKIARPVVKPALYEKLKHINAVYLREPTDYAWLCLARIGFCSMNLLEFDSLKEFNANIAKRGPLCAFLPMYPLSSRRGESRAIQEHIAELYRVGKIVFTERNQGFKLEAYLNACNYIKAVFNSGVIPRHSEMET
ncbi:hypothetical protein X943_000750 [Babesia divergens]|uniref:Uncharacterized protein n=1 Tax=Babesia divergens TaxID=32595 RepID=A0AAD9GCY2_BABDI|nr:hypothetical protein X943_000750 [Babesia divergens]